MLLSCHVRVSRVNLHSIVCLNVKELHIWTKYLKFKWQQQVSNPVRKRTNWPVLLHGWVFVYEMSGRGFEFRCYHFNLNHLPPFKYKWISVKSTCKLSVCISKIFDDGMKNKPKVLRYDTRWVSRLYNFQVSFKCWGCHYYLLIWRCLSN